MKFTAKIGKLIRVGDHKIVEFKKEFYETDNKVEIALLQKAKGIQEVKSKSKGGKK